MRILANLGNKSLLKSKSENFKEKVLENLGSVLNKINWKFLEPKIDLYLISIF